MLAAFTFTSCHVGTLFGKSHQQSTDDPSELFHKAPCSSCPAHIKANDPELAITWPCRRPGIRSLILRL